MRAYWLIDGSYLYFSKKDVDYIELKKKLKNDILKFDTSDSLVTYYFNSTSNPASVGQNAFHRKLKIAEPNGAGIRVRLYETKIKKVSCSKCKHENINKIQKGVDVGIATSRRIAFRQ